MALHILGVMGMSRHLLSRHVFACLSGEQMILMDLRHDQYLALSGESSRHLGQAVLGWPAVRANECDSQRDIDATVADLVARELLTLDPCRGKSAAIIKQPPPMRTLLPAAQVCGSALKQRSIRKILRPFRLVIAAIQASVWLRLRDIEWIVTTLLRKRTPVPIDEAAARELIASFYEWRPWLFTSNDACLFDSLTLLLFLRRFAIFPQWIFAVRTGPFAAHCWLQSEDIVLNDTVDHVRSYTPIMSV